MHVLNDKENIMVCTYCGGDVVWRGPWGNNYTVCKSCGAQGSQIIEEDESEEEDEEISGISC